MSDDTLDALNLLKHGRTFTNSRGYTVITDGATIRRYHRLLYRVHRGDIAPNAHVHHLDGDRRNNDLNNLAVLNPKEHYAAHAHERHRDERGRFVPKPPIDP